VAFRIASRVDVSISFGIELKYLEQSRDYGAIGDVSNTALQLRECALSESQEG
jgi:hypothetical protein